MAKGLDELIDWLVDEVRYYGDGKSADSFRFIITASIHRT